MCVVHHTTIWCIILLCTCLFVYACTVCKFIAKGGPKENPLKIKNWLTYLLTNQHALFSFFPFLIEYHKHSIFNVINLPSDNWCHWQIDKHRNTRSALFGVFLGQVRYTVSFECLFAFANTFIVMPVVNTKVIANWSDTDIWRIKFHFFNSALTNLNPYK